MRFLSCLLAAVPLAILHRKLPSATIRHIYAIVLGVLFAWFASGVGGEALAALAALDGGCHWCDMLWCCGTALFFFLSFARAALRCSPCLKPFEQPWRIL